MLCRSNILNLVIFGITFFGIGVIVLNLVSHNRRQNDFELINKNNQNVPKRPVNDFLLHIKADYKSGSKPAEIIVNDTDISAVPIRTYKISVNSEKHQNILVREAGEGNFNVLFFHGQRFTSKIWERIGTLQYLTMWGYRAIAIDIPDFRNGSLPVKDDKGAVELLTRLIRILRLSNLVIVSPSISGRLTLPYIIQLNKEQQLIQGFVPIAPVGTDRYQSNDYEQIKIPTLIIRGENDNQFGPGVNLLKQIPSNDILVIQNASHACYVDKPVDFHNGLRQFLYNVYRPIYTKQYKKRLLPPTDNKPVLSPVIKSVDKRIKNKKQQNINR